MKVIPNAKAPSIPSKKIAQTAYSGIGMDQVGPAAYNPKVPSVKTKYPEVNFTSSKVKSEPCEPAKPPANPGPGIYDFDKQGQKKFNSTGQFSIFQSKVPNCKDMKNRNEVPGPGAY